MRECRSTAIGTLSSDGGRPWERGAPTADRGKVGKYVRIEEDYIKLLVRNTLHALANDSRNDRDAITAVREQDFGQECDGEAARTATAATNPNV
jgi:hypothetical protein